MHPYVHDAVQDMQIARDRLLAALDRIEDGDWSRYVPYGDRTLKDLLAHLASSDGTWALAAQTLLKDEADVGPLITAEEAAAARRRAIARGRDLEPSDLREEMHRRRKLLLGLFGLLEKKHLARRLPAFAPHDSARERIWLGYHDRLHTADIERALAANWHPQGLRFLPELAPVVDALSPDPMLYVIYSVDPSFWERPAPGLEWTFRELLAHIATGDWVLQRHLESLIERDTVAEWPDVAAGNAERVGARRFSTDRALTDEFLSMRHQTMRLLSQLRPRHLAVEIDFRWDPPPNRHTVLEYLLFFEKHDRTHREQLRPAMRHNTSTRG